MTIPDFEERDVRLPEERWRHICIRHPELETMRRHVKNTVRRPEAMARSRQDSDSVMLYYKQLVGTPFVGKWICAVVKYLEEDAFVLTAYLTEDAGHSE